MLSAGTSRRSVLVVLLACLACPRALAGQQSDSTFSFVVIGHVRSNENGRLNPRVTELLADLNRLRPDLVFLTGDMIAGDQGDAMSDPVIIRRDWQLLDSALSRIGVPVYRVPGNHDLHDPVTRDIFQERYGAYPKSFEFRNSRFVLLNTVAVPQGNDSMPARRPQAVRDSLTDTSQVEFLRSTLTQAPHPAHTFVMMHHQLWLKGKSQWWRLFHPLLAAASTTAVFSGDRGPLGTFSHTSRDGVEYIQSQVEYDRDIDALRQRFGRDRRYAQLSTYVLVNVSGSSVRYEVKTLGAMTSHEFTPETWEAVNAPAEKAAAADIGFTRRLVDGVGGWKRLIGAIVLAFASFAAGVAVARRRTVDQRIGRTP